MSKKLSYRFKSKIENIYPVEQDVLHQAQLAGFDEDACFSLRLAMDESLINAIIHGNGNSEDKSIEIEVRLDREKIVVTVRDEGNGFDKEDLFDPRQEPYLHCAHGRGVFLIHQFTHQVEYNEKGNEVSFTIHRQEPISVLQAG